MRRMRTQQDRRLYSRLPSSLKSRAFALGSSGSGFQQQAPASLTPAKRLKSRSFDFAPSGAMLRISAGSSHPITRKPRVLGTPKLPFGYASLTLPKRLKL